MDIKQLEAFVCVAETKNFSQAAKYLDISQPSISNHIKILEDEIGEKLFVRRQRYSVLTDIGKTLYKYAKQILLLKEQALFECKKEKNIIEISASTIPFQHLLPIIISEFKLKYSSIEINVTEMDSYNIIDGIETDNIELGIVGTRTFNDNLEFIPIMQDSLVAVVPNKAPYSEIKDKFLSLEYLMHSDLPILVRKEASGTRRELEQFLNVSNIKLGMFKSVIVKDTQSEIIKSVKNGEGFSILSHLSVMEHSRAEDIKVFKLEKEMERNIYLLHKKDIVLSPAYEAFKTFALRR